MTDIRSRWKALKDSLARLFDTYGPVALGVWFSLFGLVFLGSLLALRLGFQAEGSAGLATVPAAYAMTQITKPVRIVITLAITPIVAPFVARWWPQSKAPDSGKTDDPL